MARKNKHRIHSSSRRSKGLGQKVLFTLLALIVAGAAVAGFIFFETEAPKVSIDKELKFLGGPVEIPFQAVDQKSGIKQIVITLEQEGGIFQLFNKSFPRQAWLSKAGPAEVKETITLDAKHAGAKEGKAELVFAVNDFSLNGMLKGTYLLKL